MRSFFAQNGLRLTIFFSGEQDSLSSFSSASALEFGIYGRVVPQTHVQC